MSHSAVPSYRPQSHRSQVSVRLPTPWGIIQLDYRAHTQPLSANLFYGYVADELGLLRITLMDQALVKLAIVEAGVDDAAQAGMERNDAVVFRWYQQYLQSKTIPILQLQVVGTEFQHQVWQGLLLQQAETFPGLKPITYGGLAEKLAMPNSARALANALGANPIAVIIPCHQVLRTDGGLGGYRWGIAMKEKLLTAVDADWGVTSGYVPNAEGVAA